MRLRISLRLAIFACGVLAAAGSPRAGKAQGSGTASAGVAVQGQRTTGSSHQPVAPFITPMGPLFAADDFLRKPWSDLGVVRRVAHAPRRLAVRASPRSVRGAFEQRGQAALQPTLRAEMPAGRLASTSGASEHSAAETPAERAGSASPTPLKAVLQSSLGPERALQIQAALVRSGYLQGQPSGSWDAGSIAAMQKLQGDHHWQTKFMPDARALILLGLGPGSQTP